MPNKRDPNKVSIGIYIDREVRDLLKELLAEKGITLTEFIYAKCLEFLDKEEDEIIDELKKFDGRRKEAKAKKNKKG